MGSLQRSFCEVQGMDAGLAPGVHCCVPGLKAALHEPSQECVCTLCAQVPLEVQPVYWAYDHALQLYPIPDALILADPAPAAAFAFPPLPPEQRASACICLNPVRAPHMMSPFPSANIATVPPCMCIWGLPTAALARERQLWGVAHALDVTGRGADLQGSFPSGTFAAYAPATKEVELCDVPEDDE